MKPGLLRLPYGDPSYDRTFLNKMTQFLKSKGDPHIGWNTEFKNKATKHLPYIPWEGISNAACSRKDLKSLPKNPNILFHDYDWKGKKDTLIAIIKKLKQRFSSFKKL